MTAQLAAATDDGTEALPRLHSGSTQFSEPFPCFVCKHMTRPPKMRAAECDVPNTRAYGGRGCCTSCYRDAKGKRIQYAKQEKVVTPVQQAQLAYAKHSLDGYLQRRRDRLVAGSVAVVETRDGRLRRQHPLLQAAA